MIRSQSSPVMIEPDPFTLTGEQRRRAARLVASKSRDAADCGQLLAMLGLTPADGARQRTAARPEESDGVSH